MRDDGVSAALAVLVDSDPDVMDRAGIGVLMGHSRKLRGFLDAGDVRFARRLRELAAAGQSESATAALMDEGRRSGKEANATRDREELCDQIPAFEDALASGAVSGDHLDALAKIAKGLDETTRSDLFARGGELVDKASSGYVSEFEKHCRNIVDELRGEQAEADQQATLERQRRESKVRRWTDEITGMRKTLIELDPIRDATWWSAIQAQLATLKQNDANSAVPYQQLEVEAVLAAVSAGEAALRIPEALIIVDDQTLRDGRHDHTVCELSDGTPLPVDTVRRMCCDAVIIALTTASDSSQLKLGREHRTASRAQRRALRALYRTCAGPACTTPFEHCRIHHIEFWRDGGFTDLENLVPLCEKCHHLVQDPPRRHGMANHPPRPPARSPAYRGQRPARTATSPVLAMSP